MIAGGRGHLAAALAAFLALGPAAAQEPLRVGSKRFTESYLLGEIAVQSAQRAGARAEHRPGLGNTAILFEALKGGAIDAYPEYTGTIAAEILKSYVSHETYEIVRTHQDFQGLHYYALLGRDPAAREQYADQPWFKGALQFTDEWDQTSFDSDYDTLSLSYFEPIIDRIFTRPDLLSLAQGA